MDIAPTLLAAGRPSSQPLEFENPPLPYADLPKRPDRTLIATQGDSTLIIRGGEYAEFLTQEPTVGNPISGRLWPASDPASERIPRQDAGQSARERSARLQAWRPDRPQPDQP